jgi:hypothetical protein
MVVGAAAWVQSTEQLCAVMMTAVLSAAPCVHPQDPAARLHVTQASHASAKRTWSVVCTACVTSSLDRVDVSEVGQGGTAPSWII